MSRYLGVWPSLRGRYSRTLTFMSPSAFVASLGGMDSWLSCAPTRSEFDSLSYT